MPPLKKSLVSMAAVAIGFAGMILQAAAADRSDIERLLHGPISVGSGSNSTRPAITNERRTGANELLRGPVNRNNVDSGNGVIVVDDGTVILRPEGPGRRDRVKVSIRGFKSDNDKEKVRQALWIAVKRFYEPHVLECAAKYSRRHRERVSGKDYRSTFDSTKEARESADFAAVGLIRYYGLDPKGRRFDIAITGGELGKATGRAPVGIIKPGEFPSYRIELHRDTIAHRTADQIAGTIFHEMMHNIGWRHGTSGKGYDVDYAKYLITEWGRAIGGDGKRSFGLTGDPYADWDE